MITYKRWFNNKLLTTPQDWLRSHFLHKPHFWAASGRGGLEYLFKNLLSEAKTGIFVPVFVAEGIILPLRRLRIPIYFYKSISDLSVDMEDLKSLVKQHPEVRIVLYIHYFGISQDLNVIAKFASLNNLFTIEDCAQAFASVDRDGNFLGYSGDVSLFSLPKSLPVSNGSLFLINSELLQKRFLDNGIAYRRGIIASLSLIFQELYLHGKTLQVQNRLFQTILFEYTLKAFYLIYYKAICKMKNPVSIAGKNLKRLKQFNYQMMLDQRRKNTQYLYSHLPEGLKLFKPFVTGAILTGLPIMVSNRDALRKILSTHKIEALSYVKSWYYIPPNQTERFEIEQYFFDHHILLPVSENSTVEDMNTIIESLKEYRDKYENSH